MWLQVGKKEDCVAEAVCKEYGNRGQYGGEAMYKEPGCGLR